MKASELRIGNFISSCFPISVVIGIDDEGVIDTAYYEHGKGVDYTSEWHSNEGSINPIPLTEEWLVKFGFSSSENVFLNLEFKKDDTEFCIMPITDGVLSEGMQIPAYELSVLMPHIKHVHQLQNLYHALTGEELTIK